jgi:dihydrofolate reductase
MGKVILSTTMSADAVIDVGEWYVGEGEHDPASREQFVGATGMLLGRKTYEGLAAYWSPLTGEWADVLNPLPKFVASRTLHGSLDWNASVIDGDVVEGVSRLKRESEGDLVAIGCGELARLLVEQELVDEICFWVHPAIAGEGTRPFQGGLVVALRLLDATPFDSGVTLLRYASS